jgi:regulator of sigma E protease
VMILTLVLFVIILGILVFSHELGHFTAAKKMGVGVEEFGFGFPPRLIGIQRIISTQVKKVSEKETINISIADIKSDKTELFSERITDTKQEIDQIQSVKKWRWIFGNKTHEHDNEPQPTIYSLNWIPIGGFVKIKGEQGDNRDQKDSFAHKKIWQRAVILSSGVLMNFILAFIIISIGFMIGLPSAISSDLPKQAAIKNQSIQVSEVQADSPAAQAGLKMGDYIISVDNQFFIQIADFQDYTKTHLNTPVTLIIKRANAQSTYTLTPKDLSNNGQGLIGAWLLETGTVSYPWYYAIWMGTKTTISITWQIIVAFYQLLRNLIVSQHISADVAGPVGIAALTGQVAKLGLIYVLQFIALLSINLAIINFFPFPALDGGRVLFLIIEKIRGKPINQRIENMVHNVGFLLIIGLVVLVTFHDLIRMSSSIKNILGHIF